MTRTIAAAAAAFATFACFATTSAAFAETAAVQITDLDLSSADGQAKLEQRITRAARAVCSSAVTGSRIAKVDAACVGKARAAIEQQLASRRAQSQNGG
jgi:UrcA family protein